MSPCHQKEQHLVDKIRLFRAYVGFARGDLKSRLQLVSLGKLIADLLFCAIDIFEPSNTAKLQVLVGWSAGFLGFYKIYAKLPPFSDASS